MKRAMVLILAVLALGASAACKSDNKVGNKALLDFKDQAQTRLGETTTTTAAATTTTAKGVVTSTTKATVKAGGAAATTTTARSGAAPPATTATTAPRATQTVREIDIYPDNDPGHDPLDPQTQTAYLGSIIRWVNKDHVPRSVSSPGQFASPLIQPGASWDYTAGTAGSFSYADDTRPYVTGTLVVAKP